MKKVMLFVLALLLLAPFCASAVTYNFDNTGNIDDPYPGDGINNAVMTVDVTGNSLIVTIDNTSPVLNGDNPQKPNSPGITGFGFDFDLGGLMMPDPESWILEAQELVGSSLGTSTLGSSVTGTWGWDFSSNGIQSINFLDFATRTVNGMNYGLYNPAVIAAGNTLGNSPRFTLATLTMTLPDDVPNDGYFDIIAGLTETVGNAYQYDVWVRLQSTDSDREGSAKLEGMLDDGTIIFIPEPSALILFCVGIAGLLAYRRKKY